MSAKRKKQDPLESDLDDLIDELEAPNESTSFTDSPLPGDTDGENRRSARCLLPLALIVILALAALLGFLLGPVRRGELGVPFRQVVEPQPPHFELLEARDGIVLLTRSEGERSEVIVQLAGQVGWRYISGSDFTAKSSALSPSGNQVAYLSEVNEVHIEVVSLTSGTRRLVTTAIVDTPLSARQLTGLSICLWSPVRWSPDEDHLAFFACAQEPVMSYATVADLLPDPPRIVWIEENQVPGDERSLIWLDSTHLLISMAASNDRAIVIDTVEVTP